jgi:hypothetical protein
LLPTSAAVDVAGMTQLGRAIRFAVCSCFENRTIVRLDALNPSPFLGLTKFALMLQSLQLPTLKHLIAHAFFISVFASPTEVLMAICNLRNELSIQRLLYTCCNSSSS